MLMATFRAHARNCPLFRSCPWSSPYLTSRTRCTVFSITQCSRNSRRISLGVPRSREDVLQTSLLGRATGDGAPLLAASQPAHLLHMPPAIFVRYVVIEFVSRNHPDSSFFHASTRFLDGCGIRRTPVCECHRIASLNYPASNSCLDLAVVVFDAAEVGATLAWHNPR